MNQDLKEKIEKRRKELYRAMKARHPDLYEKAVAVGHMALPIFHKRDTTPEAIAAEVECCAMQLAAQAVGLDL